MGVLDKIGEFLTGRSAADNDVYVNTTTATDLITNLEKIASKDMETARTNVIAAVRKLNTAKGVEEYCGIVPEDGFHSLFESMEESTVYVAKLVSDKKDSLEEYNNASLGQKILSTTATVGVQLASGFFSFFDDLGDGVLSPLGWIPAVQTIMTTVDSDKLVNAYYNTKFAQHSAITQDSAIAGAVECVGKSVPYIGSALLGGGIGFVAAAGLTGLGAGTESGLKEGKTYKESIKQGLIQGGLQATLGAVTGVAGAGANLGVSIGGGAVVAGLSELNKKNSGNQLTMTKTKPADASILMESNPSSSSSTAVEEEVPTQTTTEEEKPSTSNTDTNKDSEQTSTDTPSSSSPSTDYPSSSNSSSSNNNSVEYNQYEDAKKETAKTETKKDDTKADDAIKKVTINEETQDQNQTPQNQEQVITTPPSENQEPASEQPTQIIVNNPPQEQTQQETVQHTGVSYSESTGYVSDIENVESVETEIEAEVEPELTEVIEESTTSIDDVIKGNEYTKIPTSTTPIQQPKKSSSGNAIIPIAAGLSAAAAAGIGAKAYMDRKHNNDNGEDDDFETEEWSENDGFNLGEYSDDNAITIEGNYAQKNDDELPLDDDYNDGTEKYGARNNDELADLQ